MCESRKSNCCLTCECYISIVKNFHLQGSVSSATDSYFFFNLKFVIGEWFAEIKQKDGIAFTSTHFWIIWWVKEVIKQYLILKYQIACFLIYISLKVCYQVSMTSGIYDRFWCLKSYCTCISFNSIQIMIKCHWTDHNFFEKVFFLSFSIKGYEMQVTAKDEKYTTSEIDDTCCMLKILCLKFI